MTDYLLAVGAKTAPAARAPEHMAEWLDTHGYRIVRVPADIEAGDPGEANLVELMYARHPAGASLRKDVARSRRSPTVTWAAASGR